MHLEFSPTAIAAVRLPAGAPTPDWVEGEPLVSVTRTAGETSIICPTTCLPDDLPGPVQGPMVAVHVMEQVEFTQVGVLLKLIKPLADAGIPLLTVSTYDTDWILVPAARVQTAASVWRAAGHVVHDLGAAPASTASTVSLPGTTAQSSSGPSPSSRAAS
jgi:uncharacterized protein